MIVCLYDGAPLNTESDERDHLGHPTLILDWLDDTYRGGRTGR